MRIVTKDEFFAPIYRDKLDVHPRIINSRFPYTSMWEFHRLHGQPLYGKTVDSTEAGRINTTYYLT